MAHYGESFNFQSNFVFVQIVNPSTIQNKGLRFLNLEDIRSATSFFHPLNIWYFTFIFVDAVCWKLKTVYFGLHIVYLFRNLCVWRCFLFTFSPLVPLNIMQMSFESMTISHNAIFFPARKQMAEMQSEARLLFLWFFCWRRVYVVDENTCGMFSASVSSRKFWKSVQFHASCSNKRNITLIFAGGSSNVRSMYLSHLQFGSLALI